jgi:hypothetical protein
MAGTLWILRQSFRFVFRMEPIRQLWNCAVRGTGSQDAGIRFSVFAWWVPVLTMGSFLFSMKNPSAHTYWILVPLSFFPVFWGVLRSPPGPIERSRNWKLAMLALYLVSVNLYTVPAYIRSFPMIPSPFR